MNTKQIGSVQIKDAEQGLVEAVVSTFDVVDRDGDVLRKQAFTDGADVRISAYGHKSWDGLLPVGRGTLRVEDDRVVLAGQFFLNTTAGKDTFEVVKAMDDLQEWSYSLENVQAKTIDLDGGKAREITRVDVHEVSPVLKGASLGTRTLAVKQLQSDLSEGLSDAGRERWGSEDQWVWVVDVELDEGWVIYELHPDDGESRLVQVSLTRSDEGVTLGSEETEVERSIDYAPKHQKLSEHVDAVVAAVDALTDRLAEVKALRATKGKGLGSDSSAAVERLAACLKRLDDVLAPSDEEPPIDDRAQHELLRAVALLNGVQT